MRKGFLLPVIAVVVACGSSNNQETCPTMTQMLRFNAAGSCGAGPITVITQPGLCTLTIQGGAAAFGPGAQGQFTGNASQSTNGYDLSKGNWTVYSNEGTTQTGYIYLTCDQTLMPSGAISFSCSGRKCGPDECGMASCGDIDCTELLTPSK